MASDRPQERAGEALTHLRLTSSSLTRSQRARALLASNEAPSLQIRCDQAGAPVSLALGELKPSPQGQPSPTSPVDGLAIGAEREKKKRKIKKK